jgi:hypothetical protein
MARRLAWMRAAAVAVAGAVCAIGASPLVARPQQAVVGTSDLTESVAVLVSAFTTEIGSLNSRAGSEDIEAGLFYVISQANMPLSTTLAALDQLEARAGGNAALRQAIGNVRAALRRRIRRGTAAFGGVGFGSAFSGPIGTGGGGSSNYAR